jgi:hypothetical protein
MATEVIRVGRDDKPILKVAKDTRALLDKKTREDIIEHWFLGTKYSPAERDAIVATMAEKGFYPEDWMHDREQKSGLYPDIYDPSFGAQLYKKQEFFEARSVAISSLEGTDPCSSGAEAVFEISPIQRLISRFLNPATPYNGLLLYHGVGVGKTCTAVRVAEEYLKIYPTSKVFIIVPQAISGSFRRTIFDPSKLVKRNGAWVSQQCTGMTYPELALQELMKRSKKDDDFTVEQISDVVDKKIRERYFRFGYLQFAYWIAKQFKVIPSHLEGDERTAAENALLATLFSDKLIIIDEAHNLRDAGAGATGLDLGAADGAAEDSEEAEIDKDDSAGGKKLTPLIKRIVKYAEGLRTLFMTATPMYNKASEIAWILNLLIINDTKDDSPKKLLTDIFTKDGGLRKGGDVMLRIISQRYVSYMRGENPYTFPLRMRPATATPMTWPKIQKVGDKEKAIVLSKESRAIIDALPLIHVTPPAGSPIEERLMKVLREGKEEDFKGETWVHLDVCNIVYPNGLYGHTGWESYFGDVAAAGGGLKYRGFNWIGDDDQSPDVDSVFGRAAFSKVAPKMAIVLDKIQKGRGISFIYSRYVKAGILPLAIAMERDGWTRVFASAEARPLYAAGAGAKVPRQCAFCSRKENAHGGATADHEFKPACYVLLTGDPLLTPSFYETLNYASRWAPGDLLAPHGGQVKAILGSQITTEGLDLKCVRSIHVIDPWYHLNRIEQIIGRGVRFCSHADLPPPLRNCLIYMYALSLAKVETPDMHAYRLSVDKARAIGAIQRIMKISAMDCNLNIQGLIVRGAPPRMVVDAEGRTIDEHDKATGKRTQYDIDDKPYSSTCDYMEQCVYECAGPPVKEDEPKDTKTYTFNDAQKRLAEKEQRLKQLFVHDDVAFPIEMIRAHIYGDMPWEIVSRALVSIIESPSFEIRREDGLIGHVILQNGYLIFQPKGIRSRQIPLAYRYAKAYNILARRSVVPHRGSILGTVAAAAPVEGAAAVPIEGLGAAPEAIDDPIAGYVAWMKEVDRALVRKPTKEKSVIDQWVPPYPASQQLKVWGWLLFHFRTVPEIRKIAAQFWVDSVWKGEERRSVLEQIVRAGHRGFDALLLEALEKDLFMLSDIAGFKWVNPQSFELESYCLQKGELGVCPSSFDTLINNKLGRPVDVKAGTGEIFGFYVPRKDNTLVFKTLDKTGTKRITGAVGADCSVASDLGSHRGRVRQIQGLIRDTVAAAGTGPAAGALRELIPLLIEDADSEAARDAKGRAGRQLINQFKHIDDLGHVHVCLYMATLLRILDAKKARGLRWFMNAVEAARAGLKGR